MNQDLFSTLWLKACARRKQIALVAACMALYGLVVVEGPWGIHALVQQHRTIRQLEEQNGILAQTNKRQREHVERLRTNKDEWDLEIQRRFKIHHPGETTFMLPDPKPAETGK